MDSREQTIKDYFKTLDIAKKLEPDLRHYVKKTMDNNVIKIYKGDDVVIKVEEEDEESAYKSAQSKLISRMR